MTSRFLCLVLAALPVLGMPGGVPVAPVAVYTQFLLDAPPAVVAALQAEVDSIMAPSGLTFDWRSLATAGQSPAVELAVITFKGRCDANGVIPHNPNPGPLGWTHLTGGTIIPFADIDCEAIGSFLQRDLRFEKPDQRQTTFGRAVGRVLAHELYHIFANTKRHGSCGVGREAYSVQDLLAPTFQFEERESIALANSAAHTAVANAPSASSVEAAQDENRR